MSDEQVMVTVGLDPDYEQPYFVEADDEEPGRTVSGLVPSALVKKANDGFRAAADAVTEMCRLLDYDIETGRPAKVCDEWQGVEHTFPGYFEVVLLSVSENEYPAQNVSLDHFASHLDAERFLDSLPYPVHWVGSHRLAGPFGRERFTINRRPGWTSVGSCERCGHDRDEHGSGSDQ